MTNDKKSSNAESSNSDSVEDIEKIINEAVNGTNSELESQEGSSEESSKHESGEDGDREAKDLTPQQVIEELEGQLKTLEQDKLRVLADLENYRKRTAKERAELLKYPGEKVIVDLIDVLDSLDLAISQKEQSSLEDLQKGLSMIHKNFVDTLEKWGVVAKSSEGENFDPEIQEALSQVESADHQSNQIISEVKKSYTYKDKLIRPGQVIVAK